MDERRLKCGGCGRPVALNKSGGLCKHNVQCRGTANPTVLTMDGETGEDDAIEAGGVRLYINNRGHIVNGSGTLIGEVWAGCPAPTPRAP